MPFELPFSLLVYGYGNPGRMDDALGVRFAEAVAEWAESNSVSGCDTDSNYQLNIEDAHNIAGYDLVVFADASTEEEVKTFSVTRVEASPEVTFTMHSVSPAFVVDLSKSLTERPPLCLLVHLRGYEWELQEGLTPGGKANLDGALEKFLGWLEGVTLTDSVENSVRNLL